MKGYDRERGIALLTRLAAETTLPPPEVLHDGHGSHIYGIRWPRQSAVVFEAWLKIDHVREILRAVIVEGPPFKGVEVYSRTCTHMTVEGHVRAALRTLEHGIQERRDIAY